MPLRPLSIRRRNVSDQTLRQSQPLPFTDGLSATHLASGTANAQVASGASSNAVGSWLQLISNAAVASTDTIGLVLLTPSGVSASSTTDNSTLIDIGTGAAGSETAVVSDIAIGGLLATAMPLAIPVRISGATRVAFRSRCATASRNQRIVSSMFFSVPFVDRLPTTLDVLGTSQSTSAGTAMSGSSGTWVQITASTTRDYQALIVVPSGAANFTGGSTTTNKLDLGIGASGSEVAVASTLQDVTGANGFIVPSYASPNLIGVCGRFIPAGTRIAVRHDRASNPSWLCACVIGVPYV